MCKWCFEQKQQQIRVPSDDNYGSPSRQVREGEPTMSLITAKEGRLIEE